MERLKDKGRFQADGRRRLPLASPPSVGGWAPVLPLIVLNTPISLGTLSFTGLYFCPLGSVTSNLKTVSTAEECVLGTWEVREGIRKEG